MLGAVGSRAGIGVPAWRACFYPNYKNDFVANSTALNSNLEKVLEAYEKYKNN